MACRPRAVIFLTVVVCLVAGSAYPLECSAKSAKASDGSEYVYVSLASDTKSYNVEPGKSGEWKIAASGDAAGRLSKIDTDTEPDHGRPEGDPGDNLLYYRSIREKILAKLKRNYTRHYNDGDVKLFFILNKKGSIVRIDVSLSKSTKDTGLIDTALLSLQQAAPFGPFPKELDFQQVLFGLTVSFKRDSADG